MDALEEFLKENDLEVADLVDAWTEDIFELLETGHVTIEHNGKKLLLTATSAIVV
jgi:hypothetical protein